MKIRIEISSLANKSPSGVANYTKLLGEALDETNNVELRASYFNFLNRQVVPRIKIKKTLEKNVFIPLRVYAKLQSHKLAPSFDILLPRVDLTIFANFATWPTVHSKYRAVVIHDLTYLYFPEVVEKNNLPHLKRVVPRSVKEADFIITVSEAVKAEIVKEFAVSPEKCIVTASPPDPKYFKKNNNEIHNKYKIPTDKFMYFMGNLEPRKDLPTLVEAYRKLPKNIKNKYSLILAGGNGWKIEKSLESIRAAQEAGENVVHVGFVDAKDSAAFYQKASLFIMPSIYEGFGIPVLEAMASGCPVVASDIPVLREVAGKAAIFAKPKNSTDFCRAMKQLIEDNSLANKLTVQGRTQATAFSWAKNAKLIVDQVEKLDTKNQ